MKDDEMERALKCLAEIAGNAVLDTNADGYYHVSVCLRAMLAFAQQPEGWVLVPREPTEAMVEAGGLAILDDPDVLSVVAQEARQAWSAMLDVAPIPGEE